MPIFVLGIVDALMTMNRRMFCGLSGASLLAAGRAQAELPSLKDAGQRVGIEIGVAVRVGDLTDPVSSAMIQREAGLLTQEFALKEHWVKAHGFSRARQIYGFGLPVHGHAMYFARKNAEPAETLEVKKARYARRFEELVAEFPDCVSWDVLNEVIEDREKHRKISLFRDPSLPPQDRFAFVLHCLRTARGLVHESTQLVINDNNLYCQWGICRSKRDDMLTFLQMLADEDALPDAIGLQSHLSSRARLDALAPRGLEPTSEDQQQFDGALAFFEAARAIKPDIQFHISELDMDSSQFSKDEIERDEQHAAYLSAYLRAVLSDRSVGRVTFWGLHDHGEHWRLAPNCGETLQEGGSAKTCTRPTLFTADWQPKPAYDKMLEALQNAPPR